MPHEEIDGVPIWYEEHGDPDGPPLVSLHGGIVTFEGSFGDVLPWLTLGRRLIGVELQGHGHTPDTGRPMSIERFADDVAELVDRVAGGGPADLWGFSLGALTATGVAVRHPSKVRRLVLAAVNIRPDGYHPEITAPEQDDSRLPTEQEFAAWQAAYEAVASDPADFCPFLERMQPVVHDWPGWTDDEIRSVSAPTFLVIGDQDFVRLDHAAEMLDLFPDCRLAVLPGTKHTEVMQRSEQLRALVGSFLACWPGHAPRCASLGAGVGGHFWRPAAPRSGTPACRPRLRADRRIGRAPGENTGRGGWRRIKWSEVEATIGGTAVCTAY